jgi:uncharacterized protein (DUF433 family)
MLHQNIKPSNVIGRGVYGATEAVRLINFRRDPAPNYKHISRITIFRWLNGYDFRVGNDLRHSPALWRPDFENDDEQAFEVSFRDLIELRFVKTFRDLGLSLPTIRQCFARAVEEVHDDRPFSTRRFRTDGKSIFLEITDSVREGELIDLKQRQSVFRSVVAPSLQDLEFEADELARWYPMGKGGFVVVDPSRSFGRPIVTGGGVPTETLANAARIEGSEERVARLYEVTTKRVREAIAFEAKLAA